MKLRLLLVLAAVFLSGLAVGAPATQDREVSAWVMLEGDPVAAVQPGGIQPLAAPVSLAERKRRIALQHDALEPGIQGLGGRVTDRFDTLINAVLVRIPASQLPSVRRLPGVLRVSEEHQFRPLLTTSVPFIGAPKVWNSTNNSGTGEGMRIGIIDSGIDYLHADFGGSGSADDYANNDPTIVEITTFPTAKVAGGFDFVGDNYDSAGKEGSTVAQPDPDPLDPQGNGHGTHVAGIIAGQGVLTNGLTYTGPYGPTLDFSQFRVGPGVAPRAKLYSYKVFGRGGSTGASIVVKALQRALDPNQDGSFSDHLDVVNLSLGSPFGLADSSDPEVTAVNNLVQNGVVVVIAAGNEGNTHYIVGSPGVATRAITVANSIDDGATFSTIKILAPPAVAGSYASAEGAFTPKLADVGPVTAQVVYVNPPLACDSLLNSAALPGKIALIDRGTCFFVDKIRKAQAAGAVAVIMVNNVDGPPIEMGGSGDTSDIHIPGVMISRLDGNVLKGQLANGLTATLDAFAAVSRPELADQLNESSSRGPSATDGRLKPDLAAPGTSIFSAKVGTGTDGIAQTGTSMAAPHVAGAVALLRQARPSWSPDDLKAALMNTSVGTRTDSKVAYPESRTGAGRIQVDAALKTLVVARADNGDGDVALSFGAYELSEPLSLVRNLRVVNNGALPATFQISVSNTVAEAGVTVTPLAPTVTVNGRNSILVPVRLDIDPTKLTATRDGTTPAALGDKVRLFLTEASGQVWFTGTGQSLHVPWHVAARPTAQFRVTANEVGVPNDAVATVPLPTRGASAHQQPLVSVFQLGYQGDPGIGDAGNLVAVGAASDYSASSDIKDTQVYFGIATAGKWPSPQYELVGMEVEIDLNNDGNAEYLLVNSSAGNLNGQGLDANLSNDALLTLVADMSLASDYFTSSATLNVLDPAFRDTAPYNNRVLVHSASASAIGLGPGKTAFRYRVTATGLGSHVQTESTWIAFDAANPVIDATGHGLKNTPFFDEGSGVQVQVNRNAATLAGFNNANPPKALLLHQHNVAGQEIDVVKLRLDTADADGDGLPDAWELAYLGDLASTGATDSDGDGVNNAAEYAAGTNPLKTTMLPPVVATGTLRWMGVAGRTYSVERSSSLTDGFVPLARRLTGVTGINSFSDPDLGGTAGTWFYRVRPE